VNFNRQPVDIAPTQVGARGAGGYTMNNSLGNNRTVTNNNVNNSNAPLALTDGRDQ